MAVAEENREDGGENEREGEKRKTMLTTQTWQEYSTHCRCVNVWSVCWSKPHPRIGPVAWDICLWIIFSETNVMKRVASWP